jgi:hypothetical protein
MKKELIIIGRVERIDLPECGIKAIPAKIDTGADLSSIWATSIQEENGVLSFKLFGKKSIYYTGDKVHVPAPHYLFTRVANSFGHRELRYVVKLQLNLGGKTINATFTLADRSKKTYPILIGRKALNGKFLVDVSKGSPLKEIEARKKVRMQKELEAFKIWEKKA